MSKDSLSIPRWELRRSELAVWLACALAAGAFAIMGRTTPANSSTVDVRSVAPSRLDQPMVSASTGNVAARLDINTATVSELEMLPGIGPRRAQAILQERRKRGAFRSVWELSEVPGLTKALVRRLEPLLAAGAAPRAP